MSSDKTILILTAGYGDGHHQVSGVLKQSFSGQGYSSVRILDLFQEAHPLLNSLTRVVYLRSPAFSAYGLDYYGWSYYSTRNLKTRSLLTKGINRLGMKQLLHTIQADRPAAIIMTFPFGGVSEMLSKHCLHIPIFTVITDFSLHNRWVYSRPDQYYVATDDLKREMMQIGVPEHRITISGIPIRETFYAPADSEEYHPRSILILAGAYGLLRGMKDMVEQLLQIPDVRLNIVCGKNEKLLQELEQQFGDDQRVQLLSYVHNLDQWMRSSSCIITKAGGITLSEAIEMCIPILIYKPFPGQERENARYLAGKGAALISNRMAELKAQVEKLLDNDQERQKMVENLQALGQGRAADTISCDIIRMLRSSALIRSETETYVKHRRIYNI